jgi:Ca2+-binding RTX toxin-like protein
MRAKFLIYLCFARSELEANLNKIVNAFEVLEPRVLLDGTLDFSDINELSGEQKIETLQAMFQEFESQADPENPSDSAFLSQLKDAFFEALGDTADMFSLDEAQDINGFGSLDDVFETVRISLMHVIENFKDAIDVDTYKISLADTVSAADFDSDAGVGTFTDQLAAVTFPNVVSTPPNYAVDGDLTAQLVLGLYPDTVDTDPTPGATDPNTNDIDFLNSGTTLTITNQGNDADYTGDVLSYFTATTNNVFMDALGNGNLSDAQIDVRLDQAFADTFIEITYADPNFVAPDPQTTPPTTATIITEPFVLDPDTINELKAMMMVHYADVNAAYVEDTALTDIEVLNSADGLFVSIGSGANTVRDGDFLSAFTDDATAMFQEFMSGEALFDKSYEDLIDDYLATLNIFVGEAWYSADPNDASTATTTTYNSYTLNAATVDSIRDVMRAQFNEVMKAEDLSPLDDLVINDISSDVEFSSGANGELNVSVKLPDLVTLLNQIDLDPALRAVLPVDFDFTQVASTLTYQLSSTSTLIEGLDDTTRDDDTAKQTLTIGNLAFTSDDVASDDGSIYSFGKSADGINPAFVTYPAPGTAGANATNAVGFLEGTLIGIETAQIDLVVSDSTAMNTVTFDTAAVFDFSDDSISTERTLETGTLDDLDMQLRIKALGDTLFRDYNSADASYFDIARYQFEFDLPLSLEDTDFFAFEGSLIQSIGVNFAGFAGTAPDINAPDTTPPLFVDATNANTSVRFEVDNMDDIPNAIQPAFQDLANAVWDLNSNFMGTFFDGVSNGIAGALDNANFDLAIPLTDFDILDGFDAIADMFASIPGLFAATPEDFGFPSAPTTDYIEGDEANTGTDTQTYVEVSSDKTSQIGTSLSDADVFAMSQFGEVTFSEYTQGDGGYTHQDVTVNLSNVLGLDTDDNFDATIYLDNLIIALNDAFTALGVQMTVSLAGRALNFAHSGDPLSKLFTLAETNNWGLFGFNVTNTEARDLNELGANINDPSDDVVLEDVQILEFYEENANVQLGALDTVVLTGFDSVRFQISEGNVQYVVNVMRPDLGWGADPLDGFITAFNEALVAKGIDLLVSEHVISATESGLEFNVAAGAEGRFAVAIDPSSLDRANSLNGLMSWMKETLSDLGLMPDFSFDIDLLTGDILMDFDTIEHELAVEAGLSIDNTRLGDLDSIDLQAELAGSLTSQLKLAAGFNIFDMQEDYALNDSVQDAVFDNTFLSELGLNAILDVEATEIQAGVEWGMLSFSLGENEIENFIKINTELDATLVGQDDAMFSDRISVTQLDNLGRDMGPGSDLTDLLGRFDLTGGIVIDSDGCPVLIGTDADDTIDRLTVLNGDARVDGNETAMLLINLDTINFDMGGLGGNLLPEPLRITMGDLFDPLNTTKLCTDFDLCATLVDPGMILDGLIALADMLDAFESNLGTYMPVLEMNLPLLSGNSILSQFSFAGNFRDALVELRGDGDFGFSTINALFDDVFGEGNVAINLVTEALNSAGTALENVCELFFEIDLEYLEEFFVDIPFNLDLEQLLGSDGIGSLLGSSGSSEAEDALSSVLTNLVDAKSDARLRLDPLLGLNLTLGLDLGTLAASNANLTNAEETTTLDQLVSVNALNTNEEVTTSTDGAVVTETETTDLRIDWRNMDSGETQTILLDVDALGTDGAMPTLKQLQEAIQAELTSNDAYASADPYYNVTVDLITGEDGEYHLSFKDSASTARDDTGRDALFADTTLVGADFVQLNDTYTPRELVIGNPSDPAAEFDFSITLGDPAEIIVVNVAAEPARDLDGFVYALNDALSKVSISNNSLDGADMGTDTAILLQLFAADVDDNGDVRLQTTSFVNDKGWDEFEISITETTEAGYLDGAESLATSPFEMLETYTPRALNLNNLNGVTDGVSFAIAINGFDPVDIIVPEDTSGLVTTDAEIIDYLNSALHDTTVSRAAISDTSVIGSTVALSQILRFEYVASPEAGDSNYQLVTTNFGYNNGYGEIGVELMGNDISQEVEFTVTSVGESNIATALGFLDGIAIDGDLTGYSLNILDVGITSPGPIAFVLTDDYLVANDDFNEATATGTGFERVDADGNTELRAISASNISAELSLGTPDGLNMKLALGPVEAEIIGGQAFIGQSGGEDRGYIRGVIEDADGVDDGRYNIVDVFERAQSEDPNYLELFGLDVDFETRIDLPFSGAFGTLNPDAHGFTFQSTLLRTNGGDATSTENDNSVSAATLKATMDAAIAALPSTALAEEKAQAVATAFLKDHFVGDARQLGLIALDPTNADTYFEELANFTNDENFKAGDRTLGQLPDGYFELGDTDYGPHFMSLDLPVIGLFDCASVLDLLNDPLAMLNGLDMIMGTIDGFVSDFMADIDLPVVGDNLSVGAGFFRDFRYDVLDPAREFLETPRADGSLPTTIDLVNDFLNAALNDMVNFRAIDVFDTSGDKALIALDQLGTDSVFYGALSFGLDIFQETLPIEFALDIPGLNLEVESSTDMLLTSRLDIALGFGLDCQGGFFLLNSTDDGEEEIRLKFEAQLLDGNGPEFMMSIGGALEVSAEIESLYNDKDNPLGTNANANTSVTGAQLTRTIDNADNRTGATATIGIDLFGESGTANTSLDDGDGRTYDFSQSNFNQLVLDAIDDKGTVSTADDTAYLNSGLFDKTVYISQLNFSELAEFTFNADVDAHINLTAEFGGAVGFVPAIYTDFIFSAHIPEATFGPGGLDITKDLNITRLEFRDIHLDLGDVKAAVSSVLEPIRTVVSPIADVFNTLGSAVPISYAFDAIETIFPVVNIVNQIDSLIGDGGLLSTNNSGGGNNDYLCIGTMDFLGLLGETPLTQYKIQQALFLPCLDFNFNFNFNADFRGPGVFIEIPILQDPAQALNLLLGKFDQVNIIEVNFNLLEADLKADISAEIVGSIGLPGWAASTIRNAFQADIQIYFKAGLTMGYDLSGLINFANTLDPERLLDGIYIESQPGALIDGSLSASMGFNAGIARASGGISADLQASFVDPNNDGKLRLPELLDRVDAAVCEISDGDILGALEQLFTGQFKVDFFLNFWAGINLPWPLPDLGWGFGINETILDYTFGPPSIPVRIAETTGATQHLNVGASAGNNMSSMSQDGNDTISFSGYGVNYVSNGQYFGAASLSGSTAGVVTNLGEGRNNINYSSLAANIDTITYMGDLNDTLVLNDTGTHVIFAGDGIDNITGGGNGTYYIFAEGGDDYINVSSGTSGNVTVFTGDDYGMRDLFLETFKLEVDRDGCDSISSTGMQVNEVTINALITGSNGVLNANFFSNGFTADSQLSEDNDTETVLLSGNGIKSVYSGKGDDFINSTGAGTTYVYSGAGDDQVVITGGSGNVVEAGAGRDLVTFTGGGTNTAYGWGADADENEALARLDGDDIILGGSGIDNLHGQFGNDIIAGYLGNDVLSGGYGNDLISGGILLLTPVDNAGIATGAAIDLYDPTALSKLQTRLQLETQNVADDGADILSGGAGKDVLLGGSGNDNLNGGADSDLLIGDFGIINVSNTRIAETFVSSEITSGLGGIDILDGGIGGDILVAGGAGGSALTEIITDMHGNNVVFGDFGIVEGARILESATAYRAIPSLTGLTPTSSFGTKDNITTGTGNDIIFGGEFSDIINGGTGGDFIFGDLGSFVPSDGKLSNEVYDHLTKTVIENTLLTEGSDTITLGQAGVDDLFDLVVGGGGSDIVTSENGGLVFIGDYGEVKLNPAGVKALLAIKDTDISASSGKTDLEKELIAAELLKIERIVKTLKTVDIDDNGTEDQSDDTISKIYGEIAGLSEAEQRFGNDSITTLSGGTVFSVLGGGNDSTMLANGLSYIIGDDGILGIDFVSKDANGVDLAEDIGFVTGRSISTLYAGSDMITTSGERDIILAGDGNDIVNAGDGLNIALMDNGLLTTSDDAYAYPTILTSLAGARDGSDVYTGGAGDDLVIMGGGANADINGFTDKAELGDGTNYALGDSGQISIDLDSELNTLNVASDIQIVKMKSDALVLGNNDGKDQINAGNSDDFIILGLGSDSSDLGTGAAFLLGSTGTINVTKRTFGTLLDVEINSYDLVAGILDGNDTVINGLGDEYLVLGLGNDRAELGVGQTHVLGSEGAMDVKLYDDGARTINIESQAIAPSQLLSTPQQVDGNDYVSSGNGEDFLVLGLGSDEVSLGNGSVHIQASEGNLSYSQDADGYVDLSIESLVTVEGVIDGNETITGGTGDDFVVLGLGTDTADMGEGSTYLIGGEGKITYKTTATNTTVGLKSEATLIGQTDGNDDISSGAGRDFMILGLGGDDLDAGTGDLHLIGSAGEITFVETPIITGALMSMTQDLDMKSFGVVANHSDGDDTITNGLGAEYVIMGLGGDTGNFAAGGLHLIGGEGEIRHDLAADGARDLYMSSQAVVAAQQDGADMITATDGDDFVILGLGNDTASLGDGLNRAIGDQAAIDYKSNRTETITSLEPSYGGNDNITTGVDADVVLLGQGADTANTDMGDDLVLGDNGIISKDYTNNLHFVRAFTDGFGTGDTIDTGSDKDLIIGSYGDDVIRTGAGEDFALGDLADVKFRNNTDVETLTYLQPLTGGADTISAEGKGDNILIGQAGADTIDGADDDDWLIGDLAELTLISYNGVLPGQSALDRISYVEFTGTTILDNDILVGEDGSDFLLGGYGADKLYGGSGQDFLFGDTIRISRTYDATTGIEFMRQETNFAFVTGGYDQMFGGSDPDVLIGGLGADLFVGNTQTDLLYGDSVAAEFEALYDPALGFTEEPTPFRELKKVNFAGSSPVDLVSNAQTNSSTGVFLSTNSMLNIFEEIGYAGGALNNPDSYEYDMVGSLRLIEDFLDQKEMIMWLSEAIFLEMAADSVLEDMVEMFDKYIRELGLSSADIDFNLLQYLLRQVMNENKAVQAQIAETDSVN